MPGDITEPERQKQEIRTQDGFKFRKWRHIFEGDTQGGGHYWDTSTHATHTKDLSGLPTNEPFQYQGRAYFPPKYTMAQIGDFIFYARKNGSEKSTNVFVCPIQEWGSGYVLEVRCHTDGAGINTAIPKRKNGQTLTTLH